MSMCRTVCVDSKSTFWNIFFNIGLFSQHVKNALILLKRRPTATNVFTSCQLNGTGNKERKGRGERIEREQGGREGESAKLFSARASAV